MKASINQDLLRRLPQQNIDIRDTKLTGFILRCRASGSHSYRVILGRGRALTIGSVAVLTPHEAREEARKRLGDVAHGKDPIAAKRAANGHTLKSYLTDIYEPWVTTHRKTGAE